MDVECIRRYPRGRPRDLSTPLTKTTAPSGRPHPQRNAVLAEVHARPFVPVTPPARFLRLAYETTPEEATSDLAAFGELLTVQGLPPPPAEARVHVAELPGVTVRWERHGEFVSHTLSVSGIDIAFGERPAALEAARKALPAVGRLLVAVDLVALPASRAPDPAKVFDETSLSQSQVVEGGALVATDFRAWHDGFVRYLVRDDTLAPAALGALVQRLLELETYRTFALLGLPEAQRQSPDVTAVEEALATITARMTAAKGLDDNRQLLGELTAAAAKLEAGSAASAFRFGASRAYDGLVQGRLRALGEQAISGFPTLGAFLDRRMTPALRTCQAIEDRQSNLSRKLARAANLLRTRVEVELEEQNRELLETMNDRARAQLRLQQTVEGLSVAAISYYVVGLIGYMAKGASAAGVPISAEVATAIAAPIVLATFFFVVRRLRGDGLG